jgi:oxygen-independent coproporphyrinogen-3 oxidase
MKKKFSMPMDDHPERPTGAPVSAAPAGLYIHVPFCQAKCPYCDFYSITSHESIGEYIESLLAEFYLYRHAVSLADTLYFGGGTPSVLAPRQIERLIEGVRDCFAVAPDAEVTLEVNPGTVNEKRLAAYRRAGVNRLNIGLQSIDDQTLRFLGRIHTAEEGVATYRQARAAGFDNVGLDLMYAVPGQTRSRWEAQMSRVVQLAPEHLSCYTLTIEPGTPMARLVKTGRIRPMAEKTAAALFAFTAAYLNNNGYRQYEISNFARHADADYRSRHNRKYWTLAPYLGFGPAAHSFMGYTRWWNHRSLDDYLADLKTAKRPVEETECLTREQQIMEFIYLGLRQTDGIDTAQFVSRFNTGFSDRFQPEVTRLVDEGMVETFADRIRLTERGMRFLEHVVDRLLS